MSDTPATSLAERLAARFGETLSVSTVRNETVAELAAAELIDLCGVDYLGYGQTEWETNTAGGDGFSRGVEGQAMGRFDWAGRPRGHNEPRRYASVVHLLSIENNHRLRLRVFCEDDTLPVVP